jgi:hypothetical protein
VGIRYFATVAMGGRLYVDGVRQRAPWEPQRLVYWEEATVEMLVSRVVHRKARTVDEVRVILRESEGGLPAIRLWIAEGLEQSIRDLLESSSA